MSFSDNIKKIRTERGLTQEALANIVGVSSQAVSKWETSDTLPDGALLIPIADALGTSIDALFGHESKKERDDFLNSVREHIMNTPDEKKFSEAREIGWQIEAGFFGETEPGHICDYNEHSEIISDYGFTHFNNRKDRQFFAMFEEPEDGWCEAVGDGERARKVFELLSDRNTMTAAIWVMKVENWYIFDASRLALETGIPEEDTGRVLSALIELQLIWDSTLEVDNESLKIYTTNGKPYILMAILTADEVFGESSFNLQLLCRSKGLLEKSATVNATKQA